MKAKMVLRPGEIACIMGPSGIGKSTLLKWVCDLQDPGSASMRLQGRCRSTFKPHQWRREVMYVTQSKAPLPDAPQDLLNILTRLRVNRGKPTPDPVPFLAAMGLNQEHLERPWNELSGGEAQRTMICIALSMRPSVLLLDEPTSALDEASKRLVEDKLGSLGQCVLFVTHDTQQAGRIAASTWQVVEG